MLKLLLRLIINHYGFYELNDKLAEICNDLYLNKKDTDFECLSEAYDTLNHELFVKRKVKCK